MSNQNSELRNPIFWAVAAFVIGLGLGVWALVKEECIGPNCWVGSGFIAGAATIMIVGGIVGMFVFGNRK